MKKKISEHTLHEWVQDDFIRPIKNYEGLYYVSRAGGILSVVSKPCILKPVPDRAGYESIFLYKNKKRETRKIHRIVAQTFIPNPEHLPCVNHKDEVKNNNNVDNLEWCTHKYNITYNGLIKRIGLKQSKKVAQIDTNGYIIKVWVSASEAGRNGFASNAIAACALGRYGHKTHKGFRWEYI